MSYDISLFRLKDGVTAQQINEFLESEEFEDYLEQRDEAEENEEGDELAIIPDRFVDTDADTAELQAIIGKAWLDATIPANEQSAELKAWIQSPDAAAPIPEEYAPTIDDLFEYAGTPGMIPFCISYAGDINEFLDPLATILERLAGQRIVAFDDQVGQVIEGAQARSILSDSAEDAQEFHEQVMQSIMSGEFADPKFPVRALLQKIESLTEQAKQQMEAKEWEAAIDNLTQAWKLFPEPREEYVGSHVVKQLMGEVYCCQGDFSTALAKFDEAIRCVGSQFDSGIFIEHGACLLELGRESEASQSLAMAYDIDGEDGFTDVPPTMLEMAKKAHKNLK